MDLTSLDQRSEVIRPLGSQLVRSGETAVSAADDEGVDAMPDEVERGLAPALNLPECSTPRRPDEGASDARKAANVVPSNLDPISRCQRHSEPSDRRREYKFSGLTRMM